MLIKKRDALKIDCSCDLISSRQRMVWKRQQQVILFLKKAKFSDNDQILTLTQTTFSDSGEYSCELWVDDTILMRKITMVKVVNEDGKWELTNGVVRVVSEN